MWTHDRDRKLSGLTRRKGILVPVEEVPGACLGRHVSWRASGVLTLLVLAVARLSCAEQRSSRSEAAFRGIGRRTATAEP